MRSPFPGMDPYLEQHWRDVHSSLIVYVRDHLQAQLPSDLRARVEERVLVESPIEGTRGVYPDVRIVDTGRPGARAAHASSGTSAEPLLLDVVREEEATETFIEIREVDAGHRLVTAIEVLSSANKCPGPGQDKYLQKRGEVLGGQVNLVEIDLLRAGALRMAAPLEQIPASQRTPYAAVVRRAVRPSKAEVYLIPLRDPLPRIRVPLRAKDEDALLDLQALIEECWAKGGYDSIDYSVPPRPDLPPDDVAWAKELIRSSVPNVRGTQP